MHYSAASINQKEITKFIVFEIKKTNKHTKTKTKCEGSERKNPNSIIMDGDVMASTTGNVSRSRKQR